MSSFPLVFHHNVFSVSIPLVFSVSISYFAEMDNFHVREATAEDRDRVLRINDNVYFGFDYIESYYDYFVTSQHTTPFVLLHENTIVSCTLYK